MSEDERQHSFIHWPVGRRAAIVVAGPAANFVSAIAIFAALFKVFGKPARRRGRCDLGRQRGRGGGFQAGRSRPFDQWSAGRELSGHAADRQHQRRRGAHV